MKFGVMGAGGVGAYFGAKLAAAGNDVTFIARGPHLEALRARGLSVRSARGDVTLPSIAATSNPQDVGVVDVVLLAVKLWDTESAAHALLPMLGPKSTVVSLQNGVQKDDILRNIAGEEAVIGGVCYIAASLVQPGVIQHLGGMQKMVFGEFDGGSSDRVRALYGACESADIDAEISADIERATWEKYVFLVGLSACTAATRQPVGVVRENAQTRELFVDSMREVVMVGRARGVEIDVDYAEKRLPFIDGLATDMRASMAVDLDRGNRLELPWLSGGVVALGERFGVPTPINKTIAAVLSPYVAGRHETRASGPAMP
jgi:2-dehydropantoate 2-reductase